MNTVWYSGNLQANLVALLISEHLNHLSFLYVWLMTQNLKKKNLFSNHLYIQASPF